jgi:hypothetical protein
LSPARDRCVLQATADPWTMSEKNPATCLNLVGGKWKAADASRVVVDPLNGDGFISVPDTSSGELEAFVKSAATCPKYCPAPFPTLFPRQSRFPNALVGVQQVHCSVVGVVWLEPSFGVVVSKPLFTEPLPLAILLSKSYTPLWPPCRRFQVRAAQPSAQPGSVRKVR